MPGKAYGFVVQDTGYGIPTSCIIAMGCAIPTRTEPSKVVSRFLPDTVDIGTCCLAGKPGVGGSVKVKVANWHIDGYRVDRDRRDKPI